MSVPRPDITIRLASEPDAAKLRTLAELDSRPMPSGRVLIAELDGRLTAAVDLDRRGVIADPFRRTADLVALLLMRADQLAGHDAGAVTTLSALERRFAHVRSPKPFAALRRLA
jgi:hypothetical protein